MLRYEQIHHRCLLCFVPQHNLQTVVRFGRPATETTKRTCNVIVEVGAEGQTLEVGIVVDAVSEVLEIPASEIEPAPSFGAKIRADFIQGMGKVNGEFVIMLGLNKKLSINYFPVYSA